MLARDKGAESEGRLRSKRVRELSLWAAVVAVLVAGVATAEDRPNYVDLDLLRRARVIAVAGASAAATGADAERATTTARAIARALDGSRRVQTVSAGRVSRAMEKLELRTPMDLFKRDARSGPRLDLERAAALASRCGADAVLVALWDTPPAERSDARRPRPRLHLILVHEVRRQVIWEDARFLARGKGAAAPTISAAEITATANPLVERFVAAWRLAGDRG